jgi:hypothetical protein
MPLLHLCLPSLFFYVECGETIKVPEHRVSAYLLVFFLRMVFRQMRAGSGLRMFGGYLADPDGVCVNVCLCVRVCTFA